MANVKKRVNFFESETGVQVEHTLKQMLDDGTYNTVSSYSADSNLYPDNLIPFVDKHMHYLNTHPNIDPQHYISNLRLLTRRRA